MRIVLGRLGGALLTVWLVSVIAFGLFRLLPGDPALLIAGPLAPDAAVDQLREDMGLNDTVVEQYWDFLRGAVTGDWGYSYAFGSDVNRLFEGRIVPTLELALYAFVLALGGALVAAGIATFRRGKAESVIQLTAMGGLGAPPFWFGLVLLVVFSSWLGWLPGPTGRLPADVIPPDKVTGFYTIDSILHGQVGLLLMAAKHLLLPAVTLALLPGSFLTRLLIANIEDVGNRPFVRVLRAKGVPERRIHFVHVMRNALLPTVTSAGLVFAYLITGSVLVEAVFNWPGIGELLVSAVDNQDYVVVQTFVVLSAFIYVVTNVAVDLVNGLIDPRVRAG